jgi:hypothetical protein
MYFDRDAWEKSRWSKDDIELAKELDSLTGRPKPDTSKAAADSTPAKPATVRKEIVIDLDGIENRKARLTIHSSALSDALVSKDGETLYYLARFERGVNLWSTNLRTKETKMVLALNANGGSMQWDKNQKNIFLLADGQISRIDPATAKRDQIALAGEEALDTEAERAAMFDHVWRRTRDTFYSKGYHGVDWAGLRPVYAKYLPHIGNNFELAEMLAEMLGELNISHSGATFAASQPTDDATASLGLIFDPTYTGAGAKVAEVLREGPLDRVAVTIKPGMIIESIDGRPIPANRDIAEFLNRKAGKNVLIGVADGATKSEVVVKPVSIAEENRLLYTRWIKRNQDEVDKTSGGELGYIHIPGMNDGAMRTTFEDVMGKYATRKGVVVDTRFNGGGDLVADLAMF